jgi:hypothetical protein
VRQIREYAAAKSWEALGTDAFHHFKNQQERAMLIIATQAMHPQHSKGSWFNVPQDMGKHYKRLGWTVRDLVDRKDAESLMVNLVNGCAAVMVAA